MRGTNTIYSYTSSSFSDALNTLVPPANGSRGLTPSYSIWDMNISYKVNNIIAIRSGLNNILNNQYFTKRPTFYPGSGIWPSDGRNGYVTVAIKIDNMLLRH